MYSGYKSSSHTTVGGTSIGTTNGDVSHNWQFGVDGRLTFPDATVQTTAYTGQDGISGFSGFSGTSGFSGINGAENIIRQDTPPVANNGTLWFNTLEGRMYIKYTDVWVDASPLVMPQPDPDLDVNSVTFADASVQTTAFLGTVVVDRLTNGTREVVLNSAGNLLSSNDIITVQEGRFIKDCGDSTGTTSMRWIRLPADEPTELIRVYSGDPSVVNNTERVQLNINWSTPTKSGLGITAFDRTAGAVEHTWQFLGDGATTFPTLTVPISDNANPNGTGQTLKFSDPTQQAIIFGPESTSVNINAERIIIQGAPGFTGTTGEGGDVYVWAGPGGSTNGTGGDIKVRAGQGSGTGTGGYLNFQAGDSGTGSGGYINIESGESATPGSGGDITVQALSGGEITLRTYPLSGNANDWDFKNDGSTVFPNNTIQTAALLNVTTNHVPLYSNQFNGSQSISIADSSTLRLGDATAWTIESWVYMTAYPVSGAMTIIDKDTVVGVNYQTYMLNVASNGRAAIYTGFGGGGNNNPTGKSVESSINLPLNEWVHLAAVWDGADMTLYQGGVSVGTVAAATTPITGEGGLPVTIGRSDNINYFAGKISNLRIVKNTAVYTGTFTPSDDPLTAITNTSLLTCNASTITVGSGNAVIVNESPWGAYDDKTWQFGTDGGLALPTAGRISNGVDIQQVGSALVIADNGTPGGLVGWSSQALAIAYDANIISTYPVGSTITWQDGSTATITQWDDYGPLYIDLFWDTPKTGDLFPITLTTANYVAPVIAPAWTFGTDGGLTLPEGSVISETATTTVITPPGAAVGQSLVIRPTAVTNLSASGYIVPGVNLTITLTNGTITVYDGDPITYTITGTTAEQLGIGSLTGTFSAFSPIDSVPQTTTLVLPIPEYTNATTFTLTVGGSNPFASSFITVTDNNVIETSHIHLVAGDPVTTDIYLGDDDQYVKIEKNGGDVVVGTNSNTQRWVFGTDGGLTFPDGDIQPTAYAGGQGHMMMIDTNRTDTYTEVGSADKPFKTLAAAFAACAIANPTGVLPYTFVLMGCNISENVNLSTFNFNFVTLATTCRTVFTGTFTAGNSELRQLVIRNIEFANTFTLLGDTTATQFANTSIYNASFSGAVNITTVNNVAFYEVAFFGVVTIKNINYMYINGAQFNTDLTFTVDDSGATVIPSNGIAPMIVIAFNFIANNVYMTKVGSGSGFLVFQPHMARMGLAAGTYNIPAGFVFQPQGCALRGTYVNSGSMTLRNTSTDDAPHGVAPAWTGVIGGDRVIADLAPTTSHGAIGDRVGMIAVSAGYLYICTANWTDGVADIWSRTAITATSW